DHRDHGAGVGRVVVVVAVRVRRPGHLVALARLDVVGVLDPIGRMGLRQLLGGHVAPGRRRRRTGAGRRDYIARRRQAPPVGQAVRLTRLTYRYTPIAHRDPEGSP